MSAESEELGWDAGAVQPVSIALTDAADGRPTVERLVYEGGQTEREEEQDHTAAAVVASAPQPPDDTAEQALASARYYQDACYANDSRPPLAAWCQAQSDRYENRYRWLSRILGCAARGLADGPRCARCEDCLLYTSPSPRDS